MTCFKISLMMYPRLVGCVLFCILTWLTPPSTLRSQVIVGGLAGPEKPSETVELLVSPAAEPNPVFKHRLTVPPHRTIPGNAALTYSRSLAEGGLRNPFQRLTDKYGWDSHSWWDANDYKDIDPDKIIDAASEFDDYVREFMARATLQRDYELRLGMEDLQGEDVLGFSLSFEQETRSMSRALALQTRAAIIEKRYDDAVELIRMNYQLAQNVAKTPAIVAGLCGISEVGVSNHGIEQLIGAEGSPNMYWALTELPSPIVSVRKALRMEHQWGERMIPELMEAEKEHTDAEWHGLLNRVAGRIASGMLARVSLGIGSGQKKVPASNPYAASLIGLATYRAAKNRLIASGFGKEEVEAMRVSKVLIKDAARQLARVNDFAEKEIYLPYPSSAKRINKVEEFMISEQRLNNLGAYFASLVLPAVAQVRRAQLRIDRNICALRVVEAMRMHVAQTGSFPEKLGDITVVPVPDNPATNRPFEYQLKDGTATLDLPRDGLSLRWKRYIIRLRN